MGTAALIVLLLLLGIGLVLTDLILVPGTHLLGLVGGVMSLYAVYLSFAEYGPETGAGVLVGTLLATASSVYYAFKSGAWQRLALNDTHTSTVNDGKAQSFPPVGAVGKTLSTLKPLGTAEFGDDIFEVRTTGAFLDEGKPVRLSRVDGLKLFVEPLQE